jgi:hypothetical protein
MKCPACCAAHTFCQFRYRSAPFSVPCLHLLVRLQLLVGPRALDGAPQFSLLEWQGVRCALGPSRLAAVAYAGEHSGPHPCASGYQSVAGDPDAACPSAYNPAIRVKFPHSAPWCAQHARPAMPRHSNHRADHMAAAKQERPDGWGFPSPDGPPSRRRRGVALSARYYDQGACW